MPKKITAVQPRPVKLQINNSGSWKNLTHFDASDDLACTQVLEAANTLGNLDAQPPRFRVATAETYPVVLMSWDKATGWQEASVR